MLPEQAVRLSQKRFHRAVNLVKAEPCGYFLLYVCLQLLDSIPKFNAFKPDSVVALPQTSMSLRTIGEVIGVSTETVSLEIHRSYYLGNLPSTNCNGHRRSTGATTGWRAISSIAGDGNEAVTA